MEKETFTTTILRPSEGMYLTQKDDVEILNRTVATMVAVGRNDSPENWIEISAEEASAYIHERESAEDGTLTSFGPQSMRAEEVTPEG